MKTTNVALIGGGLPGAGANKQLIKAVLSRDIDSVRQQLHLVGRRDANGMTALMYAAQIDFLEAVQLLVDVKKVKSLFRKSHSEAGLVDSGGRTALMHAAINGSKAVIPVLLQYEKLQKDYRGYCALHYATINNDADCVSLLVDAEANTLDRCGRTALFLAIQYRAYAAIPYLLQHEGHTMVTPRCCVSDMPSQYSEPDETADRPEFGEPVFAIRRSVSAAALHNALSQETDRSALTEAVESLDAFMVRLVANTSKGMCDANGRTALMMALDKLELLAQETLENECADDEVQEQYVYYQNICSFLAGLPEEVRPIDAYGQDCLQRAQRLGAAGAKIIERMRAADAHTDS